MKKRIVSCLCVLLCLCLLVSACSGVSGGKENEDMQTGKETEETPEVKEEVLAETDYRLIKDGVSEYKIVIPEKSTAMLNLAATELQEFLRLATGVTIEIVSDTTVTEDNSVISLGRTVIAEKLGVQTTEEDNLDISGYITKTIGKNIVILDAPRGNGEGVLYGVYDFLYDAIKFKVYAADEIVYDKKDEIPVYDYDKIADPSFDERSLSYYDLRVDRLYMYRMRLFNLYDFIDDAENSKWGIFGHTQLSILPYTDEHPDWFAPGGSQLCYSAGDDMVTAFSNNLIELIKSKPNASLFMLGHMDNQKICNCEKCVKNLKKYGNISGLQISFLNRVIEKTEVWREANLPERDIRYAFYAYQITLKPAVKKDGNGGYIPYHEDCALHEKLYVYFAPVEANYSIPLEDKRNAGALEALQQWSAVAKGRILVYAYDTNFRNYFVNFNNFETMQEHFQTYYEHDIDFMYSQGPIWKRIPSFTEMRIFVESQLMWNMNLKYDDLVTEFMNAYYEDGAAGMRKYYDFIRENFKGKEVYGGIFGDISSSKVYDFESIAIMDGYIDEALRAIEPLRKTDNERFATLYFRIKKEELSVLWLKLRTFSLYYTDDELEDFALEFYFLCDKLELSQYKEVNGEIGDMFENFVR